MGRQTEDCLFPSRILKNSSTRMRGKRVMNLRKYRVDDDVCREITRHCLAMWWMFCGRNALIWSSRASTEWSTRLVRGRWDGLNIMEEMKNIRMCSMIRRIGWHRASLYPKRRKLKKRSNKRRDHDKLEEQKSMWALNTMKKRNRQKEQRKKQRWKQRKRNNLKRQDWQNWNGERLSGRHQEKIVRLRQRKRIKRAKRRA